MRQGVGANQLNRVGRSLAAMVCRLLTTDRGRNGSRLQWEKREKRVERGESERWWTDRQEDKRRERKHDDFCDGHFFSLLAQLCYDITTFLMR